MPDRPPDYFPLDLPDYRFDQRNEMFKRRTWDPEFIPHGNRLYGQVKYDDRPGYTKPDYALRNAAWNIEYAHAFGNMKSGEGILDWNLIADKAKRFVETDGPVKNTPERNQLLVKRAARFLGADMVGTCHAHPNLVYSHQMNLVDNRHEELELPEGCNHAIVLAVAMDYETTRYSPDAISGAATGLGYSMQAVVANLVAAFVKGLGYKAIPSGNDTAISIPLAIAAGLGELGRMGLLITKPFGPRVRIAKVFTDLPLAHDKPVRFGVEEFCRVCKKCAKNCPSKAISTGEPTREGPSLSNFSGVEKWYINPEKCFMFWVKNWMDCNNCVMSCPFNKAPGRIHDVVRWHIKNLPFTHRPIVWMDDLFGYGKPLKGKSYWD